MRNVLYILIAVALLIAFVAHESHRDVQDVTARDVARVVKDRTPQVEVKDGAVTIKPR